MKWVQKTPLIPFDQRDTVVTKLCKINGIDDVWGFLNPSEQSLHDKYLLGNIREAATVISSAIDDGLRIGVSFDVDADGITSGSIMFRYLTRFTENVYKIVSERSGGHGIENQMDKIQPNTDLIVICDSSTSSEKACTKIFSKAIRVVVLDHHPAEQKNPYALIVNPQLDKYPNKELSGAGVVYKTLQAVDDLRNCRGTVDEYLDLVAVGLCSDVMSMTVPENRYLVYKGLKNIINPGLKAILKVANMKEDSVTSTTIGFTIGPNLNGASRLDQIDLAISLMTEDEPTKCMKLAKEVQKLNESRKITEAEYYAGIKPKINPEDKVIIVVTDGIDGAFNGLIATKIASAYKRPAMVLQPTGDNESFGGSFRSYGDFNLKEFLSTLPHGFVPGGHAQAGGFVVKQNELEQLRTSINTALDGITFEPTLEYDLEIDSPEISTEFIREVEKFNFITGKDLSPAKFVVRNLFVIDAAVIGKNNDTIKIQSDGITLMKFKTTPDYIDKISSFGSYDALGLLNVNEFYNWGKRQLIVTNQIFLDDIQESS